MWATLQRLWWVPIAALLALAWSDMREWGAGTWVGFGLAGVVVIVVYSALYVSGTCAQWEEDQAFLAEIAREHVAMGTEEEEEEAA